MADDGSIEGHLGIPMLDRATLNAGVAQAKKHGMLTVARLSDRPRDPDGGPGGHRRRGPRFTGEIIALIRDARVFAAPAR
jgi:hypothetical protein